MSLSARGGEETHAADAWTKSPLQTPTCAHERVPRCGSILRSRRGLLRRFKGNNHADGSAAVR